MIRKIATDTTLNTIFQCTSRQQHTPIIGDTDFDISLTQKLQEACGSHSKTGGHIPFPWLHSTPEARPTTTTMRDTTHRINNALHILLNIPRLPRFHHLYSCCMCRVDMSTKRTIVWSWSITGPYLAVCARCRDPNYGGRELKLEEYYDRQ